MKNLIIEDVKQCYANCDVNFTHKYYLKNGNFSGSRIYKIMGGWNKTLNECEIPLSNPSLNVTKNDLIKEANVIFERFGYLNSELHRKNSKYSQKTIDREFKSFSKFIKATGIKTSRVHRAKDLTDIEILDELKLLYDKFNFLNCTLIKKEYSVSLTTLIKRFGNMSTIYQLLDIEVDPNSNCYFWRASNVIKIFSDYLKEKPLQEWTCPGLKNPETTNNLFVDAYFPLNNIALEYDSIQHYEYIPFMHKTYDNFIYRQNRDKIKNSLLSKMGIKIIRVKYDDVVDEDYVKNKLKL